MNEQNEKLNGTSLDISADNRAHLKALFPTVFTETKNDKGELVESIDFEKLKAELGTFSDVFEARRERYGMDWPGKKEALRLIQTPSAATLKPCREESVNFDTTENLFIEGDNLEVLKLLQKSYYGKVKMIYIDPPYNTGKEFIYPDNFSESLDTYLEYAGLIDGEGKKFSTNTANEGRFHTKWLNMMYPRLYLARNLLRDDGVIFISIDDNEITNLKKLCDEVFGEENFVTEFIWEKKKKPAFLHKNIGKLAEYILCYVKHSETSIPFSVEETEDGKKTPINNAGNAYSRIVFPPNAVKFNMKDQIVKAQDMSEGNIKTFLISDVIIKNGRNFNELILDGEWRYSQETIKDVISSGDEIRISKIPFRPNHIKNGGEIKKMKNMLSPTHYGMSTNEDATECLQSLFDRKDLFDNPKPFQLIQILVKAITYEDKDDIVMDFFSGSATTAHAVLDLNKQDNGNRRFILVQLPEPTYEIVDGREVGKPGSSSEAFGAGYRTIADIGKERIRRVIKKIKEEQEGKLDLDQSANQDLGFKVLKLDKSNFRQWQQLDPSTPPEKVEEELFKHIGHISDKATPENLLYEILLKAGFTPTEKIETKAIAGKNVFSIAGGALLLCLEDEVTKELINAVAELEPMQFICLDGAFHGNDQLKANAVQTFAARNMQKEKHNQIIFKTV